MNLGISKTTNRTRGLSVDLYTKPKSDLKMLYKLLSLL